MTELAPDHKPHLGTERPDLNKLLEKWVTILKLQDWEIKSEYVRHWDLGPGDEAGVKISLRNKTAAMRVLDPADYCSGSWPYDVERTFVHELVHLHVEFFGKAEGLADQMREQAVESIARALIQLDRRRSPN